MIEEASRIYIVEVDRSAEIMTWDKGDEGDDDEQVNDKSPEIHQQFRSCPSCGQRILWNDQGAIHELPGLPAGVKFDPTDQELLEHLEGKAKLDSSKLHALIDEFIPTLEGENGICYTHPEKLPGVTRDGVIRHFFHRPSKAYTTGTRKRRKVHTDEQGGETRWHKTGKTRPVYNAESKLKGYKKILVLYTNYGKQKKPEKTSWVMHQYHLGSNEEEKDGELVVSKVFFQTQPRQCGSSGSREQYKDPNNLNISGIKSSGLIDYYNSSLINQYDHHQEAAGHSRATPPHLLASFSVHDGGPVPSLKY